MPDHVYDDNEFFAAYSQLPRSMNGLAGAAEWPVLQALLPDVAGKRIVDLGCGFGWFCRWAVDHGAESVVGIDVSNRMLARARADTADKRIVYLRADLGMVDLQPGAFDLAYSSLTLHYLVELDRLFTEIHRSLVARSPFVFSVEHPIYTVPSSPGFVTDEAGASVWPLNQYLLEGQRTTDWLAPGVIKQHRTIASYIAALHRAGFALTDVVEWGPSEEQVAEVPEWAVEVERPAFLLIAAVRR